MTRTAILYASVSTDEQAESGYSVAQQVDALREYAEHNDLQVLEVVTDRGYSGATLERPGLDRVRDIVAGGGVDMVLAQDIDRISREPWQYDYLRSLFAEYGTELRALDDNDDGSPMGEFVSYVRRGVAKLERAECVKRSRRNRLQKAREGKVIGNTKPNYGFFYNADRTICVAYFIFYEYFCHVVVLAQLSCSGVVAWNHWPLSY
jgi:site-specific DNA recombinase